MKLVIVESPSKVKTITKYLGGSYTVLSSYGHIRKIPSKPDAVEPNKNFYIHYDRIEKVSTHIKKIVQEAKKANVIYLATDPDREGESISWHILEVLKEEKALSKNTIVNRITFNEITQTAINEAIKNAREINIKLVYAQQARQALDYLVGYTLSPILWRKLPGSKSAGRVQSVTLKIICEREAEIEKFEVKEHWSIEGEFNLINSNQSLKAQLYSLDNIVIDQNSIHSDKINEITQQISKQKYLVKQIKNKKIHRSPPAPFITSTLIQIASTNLGFSARKTMQVAQRLYEGIKIKKEYIGLITYMRTDSVNISNESVQEIRDFINTNYGNSYLALKIRTYKSKTRNAQEAHEAIRPTAIINTPLSIKDFLEPDEYKLYDIIWKRSIASQMTNAAFDNIRAEIISANESVVFMLSESYLAFTGFYRIYDVCTAEQTAIFNLLKKLQIESEVKLTAINPIKHLTQPPAQYTEASLVQQMEKLGIGRPSTYHIMISILVARKYVILENKKLIPQELGRLVNTFLTSFFFQYVQYDFTAELENELDDVAKGNKEIKNLFASFWFPFKTKSDEVMKLDNKYILKVIEENLFDYIFHGKIKKLKDNNQVQNADLVKQCPKCKQALELKNTKTGSFIGCSGYPSCNFAQPLKENDKINKDAKVLGIDNEQEIILNKGRYGYYISSGKYETKKHSVTIPLNIDIDAIDLQYAKQLLSLPKLICLYPENNMQIKLHLGKYGPYLAYDGKFISVKKEDFLNITPEETVALVQKKLNK